MQGILVQQQQFTQQLLLTIGKEFQPTESLIQELKHQLESFFIEIKQVEYELKEQLSKYCHNCAIFKQQIMEECEQIFNESTNQEWKTKIEDINTELMIIKACNQQLETQKIEIQQKLSDQRNKYEELNKQRKEDKDNYRQQYESLKKKAQDKIHRLKDKIVIFQTQLQTFAIESEHLRIIAQEKSENLKLKDSQLSMKQQINTQEKMNKSNIKQKLKGILLDIQQLKNQSNTLLLQNSKIILQAREQLQIYSIKKDLSVSRNQTGTIIRRNNTPPEPNKLKLYYSQSQSIQSSPDRKLKTEKPSLLNKRLTANRSSISKNLLAEFDASAQITKFIKQYYNGEQQLRNSTGFHPKLF